MAKHVIVGCAGLPTGVGWSRYFQRLPYLELNTLHVGPVRASVQKRWRQSVTRTRAFGVVAPAIITHEPGPKGFGPRGWPIPPERKPEVGRFRPGELRDHGVAALVEACDTLDAAVAIFRTGPEFTPSSANRDLMRRFFAEVVPAERLGECVRVWHPTGLWDPPMAQAFAEELGIVCAHDPLGADPTGEFAPFYAGLHGDDAYLHVSGLGRARRHLAGDQLEEIAEMAQRHQRAWVVLATNQPFADAIRLGRAMAALDHGDDVLDEADDAELPEADDDDDDE
ncbi:MAG: DUF72 domain-containing protein [Kofleriaceae bacterium]